MHRFPPPWTVEELEDGFKVVDASGQALAYVQGHTDSYDAGIAKGSRLSEAHSEQHRQAANLTWFQTPLLEEP
jgi:hypothetical protein